MAMIDLWPVKAPEALPVPVLRHERSNDETQRLKTRLPELLQLERLIERGSAWLDARIETEVIAEGQRLPIYSLAMGSDRADAPSLIFTGGIHGIERIGAQIILAFVHSLLERLKWDEHLHEQLKKTRLVFLPIANPGGMYMNLRCNPNGVDLMRNSPINAGSEQAPFLGGQSFSRALPWYRGTPSVSMEQENQVIESLMERHTRGRPFSMVIDCHSGFGFHDRIWFPYAYRRRPVNNIAPIMALKLLWERTYPNHNYVFEPQSNHYITSGDVWDYFFKRFGREPGYTFIPLTLELGSWLWVKKRPRQLLSFQGLFNPLTPHRLERVLRRHLTLFEFMMAATVSSHNWLPQPEQEENLRQMALSLWYKQV